MRFVLHLCCLMAASLLCLAATPSNKALSTAFLLSQPQHHGVTRHETIRNEFVLYSSVSTESGTKMACEKEQSTITSMQQVNTRVQQNDTASPILVEGIITAKRSFGSSFGFLDMNTDSKDGDDGLVQIMVKRQAYQGELNGLLDGLSLGMHISVQGVASETRNPGEGVVLVHSCNIVGLPPNPQHVRKLLRLVLQNKLSVNQVAPAANMTSEELSDRILIASKGIGDFTTLAKELISWSSNKQERTLATVVDDPNNRPLPSVPSELCHPPSSLTIQTDVFCSGDPISIESVSDLCSRTNELSGEFVRMEAWVQNRRKFQDSITVLKISDSFVAVSTTNNKDVISLNKVTISSVRCQCVLHPSVLRDDVAANVYGNLLCTGSRVRVGGFVEMHQPESGTPTLWITHVEILRCSWRPMVIRYLIELVVRDEFDIDEASQALGIDSTTAAQLSQLDLTERQWKANDISRSLQDSQTRMASVSDEMLQVLASFEGLRQAFPLQQEEDIYDSVSNTDKESLKSDTNLPQKTDKEILSTNRPGTWWQRKKRPQLEFMGRQIRDVVRSHPDYGKRTLRLLDVGGGKGLLATYLAQLLGDTVQVQVIDIAGGAIKNGMMKSKRLALDTPVEFVAGDASQFEHESDIVVALHACGSLSDVALGHAVNNGAGFVICPCCFRSNGHLRVPVRRDGNVRAFQLPHEWLNVESHVLDTVKRIAEIQGEERLASEGMHALCAIRANAARRHSREKKVDLEVSIKTFPMSYSTRNICLVGKVRNP